MNLIVNGESKNFSHLSSAPSLLEIIQELKHHPKTIVVELNGLILSPGLWNEKVVKHGDRIEIVTIVGGGS
ncbi:MULTISPECIES: sulfur carrier protein ThiS [Prochlorococcus]|uniref:sulfur carrier protein ThiS n=1 Tax=Prochlorococcus TaxID=1218 RepID=UPI000533715E|nr:MULTISPECIES: sulfur carrier protein ThiS [Prochlorococcus]KGG12015.1 Sulfur carrier protein ThiS [Prochlorococcus sp. MIT 0601]